MINLKFAFRTLLKTPFVTAAAVTSLALGIGTNTAIFSLFNEMLLRPLPVSHPEQLVNLAAPGPKPGSQSCGQAGDCEDVFSYQMFRDLQRAQTVFTGIAAHVHFDANLAYRGQTENKDGLLVSGSYFPVLGIKPALGRLLSPSDDQTIGGHYVAVLSYSYWETKLGASPGVLNQTMVINGQPVTVIGVAPQGFEGTTLGILPSVFMPISMRGVMVPGWRGFENRSTYWAYLFARLKPGVTMDHAAQAINGVYHPIVNDVEVPLQKGMSDATMARFKTKKIELTDGRRGQSSVHKESRTPLTLLFAITGIVLLIACANIANLLLARGASRSMEMAVRLSLGASRRQLLSQLLVESCLLAVLGGVTSLLVAYWTLHGIAAVLPPDGAGALKFGLSGQAILFASVLSVGTGLLFGLFPALNSTRPDLVTTIRANAGQLVGAQAAARFRMSLVTAQIALSMALLISAGLFIKSLRNVSRVDLGVRVDNLVTFALSPELNGYTPVRTRALLSRVEEEVAALPGVTGVSSSMVPLLSGNNWGTDVSVEGFKKDPDTDANARYSEVGPGYYHTVGIKLLAGREFTLSDGLGSPKVAIVNETFAKKFGLGRDAVGKHMATNGADKLDIEIIGLAQDAKYSEVKQKIPPVFVMPWLQDSTVGFMNFYVRTSGSPQQLLRAIPGAVKKLDPNLPVVNLKSMEQQVKENVFLDRMISTLAAAFALLATVLAAVGLYGVLAYSVAQRTREIGVRMALGADGRRVQGMVLRQVAKMTLIGGTIGVIAALFLGRTASTLLFELKGTDPVVMVVSVVILSLVAFGAGYLPARRASTISPMQALRQQ